MVLHLLYIVLSFYQFTHNFSGVLMVQRIAILEQPDLFLLGGFQALLLLWDFTATPDHRILNPKPCRRRATPFHRSTTLAVAGVSPDLPRLSAT